MLKRSLLLSVLTLALALFGLSVVMADAPVEGRVGRIEVRFMEEMIDHHHMGVMMANDCLAKATTESLLTTCQNIVETQTAEIATMQDWLLNWYGISYVPSHTEQMNGMSARLDRLEGVEYEIAWIEAMIDHHEGAIRMSERFLAHVPEGTGHAELREMAQQIITAQTAEIAYLEMILAELTG